MSPHRTASPLFIRRRRPSGRNSDTRRRPVRLLDFLVHPEAETAGQSCTGFASVRTTSMGSGMLRTGTAASGSGMLRTGATTSGSGMLPSTELIWLNGWMPSVPVQVEMSQGWPSSFQGNSAVPRIWRRMIGDGVLGVTGRPSGVFGSGDWYSST